MQQNLEDIHGNAHNYIPLDCTITRMEHVERRRRLQAALTRVKYKLIVLINGKKKSREAATMTAQRRLKLNAPKLTRMPTGGGTLHALALKEIVGTEGEVQSRLLKYRCPYPRSSKIFHHFWRVDGDKREDELPRALTLDGKYISGNGSRQRPKRAILIVRRVTVVKGTVSAMDLMGIWIGMAMEMGMESEGQGAQSCKAVG
ncbi:hypothetical protein KQX54_009587 [Cotesia glomerata]|uniref:Uncharacterized protein n=1 Tax=Cotesia glomerata TaxID=32391 RepID=A0AAV7J2M2_COTGL|nr:hypothetical protein KQX54_009587 [Cotesia glomerata]